MVARHWSSRLVRHSAVALALAATGWLAGPVGATELDKLDTSLKLIPEDAAFYSSMLRNREQFEAIRNSNAWAKVREMPVVQMGLSLYQAQLGTPSSGPAKVQAAWKNPEVRKIIDLVADMVSDDVFLSGDDSCTDFMKLMQDVGSAVQYGPMVLQATGKAAGLNPNQLQAKLAVSALAQHADLIEVPNFVLGFKLNNADLAKEELIKLETMGNILLESNEQTKGHFKKSKVGKYDYLVLELDGEMVPWDQVPMDQLKQMELNEGDFQKIIDKLKETKLSIALGVRENYLICSIGSSLEWLEKLGQGKRLIDRTELKPLAKFVDKRLTSIGYVSEEMLQQLNNRQQTVDGLLKLVDKLLPLAKLSEEQNAADPERRGRGGQGSQGPHARGRGDDGLPLPLRSRHRALPLCLGRSQPHRRLETAGTAPTRRRQPNPGPGRAGKSEHRGLQSDGQVGQDGLRLLR